MKTNTEINIEVNKHIFTGAVWHNDEEDDDIVVIVRADTTVYCCSNKFDFERSSKIIALAYLIKLGYHYIGAE